MQKADALKFCEQWLAAWTGNHPNQLIEYYTEDSYYSDPAKPNGIRGKTTLLQYFQKLLAKYPDWIWKVEEIIPYELGFVLKWKATLNEHRNSINFFGLDIVEMQDNKIKRNEVYFDPAPLIAKKDFS